MGRYDIPAILNYINETTGYEKIAYIGYSCGTTQLFYGMTVLPEYFRSKLSVFVALAPITKIANSPAMLLKVTNIFYSIIVKSLATKKVSDFAPTPTFKKLCNTVPWFCRYGATFIVASTMEYDDPNRFQVYMNHAPAGLPV